MPTLQDIRIRDPYILAVSNEAAYYLFGTTDENVWDGPGQGFDCYRSTDLEHWSSSHSAFRPPEGFWATQHFWAPEVYEWQGRYVMFATFAGHDGRGRLRRGTQALVANEPAGPYEPLSDGTLTPREWLCLDGTLVIDPEGLPWLVFCREWLDVHDGQMLAQRLSLELDETQGEPIVLFSASQAPWTVPLDSSRGDYVTDGPGVKRMSDGSLVMTWSSVSGKGYAVGAAYARSGLVTGPWEHDPTPLWDQDGGHAMSLAANGLTHLVLHHPNTGPRERTLLIPLTEVPGREGPRLQVTADATLTA